MNLPHSDKNGSITPASRCLSLCQQSTSRDLCSTRLCFWRIGCNWRLHTILLCVALKVPRCPFHKSLWFHNSSIISFFSALSSTRKRSAINCQPLTRILTSSFQLPPSSALGSSSGHAWAAHISSVLGLQRMTVLISKRTRSQIPTLPAAATPRHASFDADLSPISVFCRQGRVLSFLVYCCYNRISIFGLALWLGSVFGFYNSRWLLRVSESLRCTRVECRSRSYWRFESHSFGQPQRRRHSVRERLLVRQ